MKDLSEKRAMAQASEALRRYLAAGPSKIIVRQETTGRIGGKSRAPATTAKVGGHSFLIEYKASGKINYVAPAIERIREASKRTRSGIWLLVVPYMHEAGRALCEEAGVSWLDLSGNAEIAGPGVRISVSGRSNAFRGPGRPSNLFAPRSSRVARLLLYQPNRSFSQRQLAAQTGLGEGYVSRVVRGYRMEGLVDRGADGNIGAHNPALLLDAWLEAYKFSQHSITIGHIPARSGQSLAVALSGLLVDAGIEHAHTGLGAAWLYSHFASFRLATVYLKERLPARLLSNIGFTQADAGANIWLVVPKDEAVFWGKREVEGLPCVHPIQVLLDLKGHPERATEAAAELRPVALHEQVA